MPKPEKFCDIVMKGGITSGVVYPLAISELSKHYRFQNIGGTSAGAIAAVFTAAAEYGRDDGGFEKINALPDELSDSVLEKFQPTPKLAPLFKLALATLERRPGRIIWALLSSYWLSALIGGLPGIVLLLYGVRDQNWGFALLGALLLALLSLGFAGRSALRQITRDLPDEGYGMCPGIGQPGAEGEALSDWITRMIDHVAGRDVNCPVPVELSDFSSLKTYQKPLTIGDLADREIQVATVTTDLTTRRPYKLPIDNNLHFFSRREFLKYFPERVVLHMCATSSPVDPQTAENPDGDLYYFQNERDLPVVVLARMSLSFPILLTTIPLYRCDYTFKSSSDRRTPVKCHFSDGGISSNFPIQFFDQFLPHTPTFGISLADLDPRRFTKEQTIAHKNGNDDAKDRVSLPTDVADGQLLPTSTFQGIVGFFSAMFSSAKDWQDSLQSILTGYRERIVTVNLLDNEGGLNLDMCPKTVRRLTEFGGAAGRAIVSDFNLDEHRWRRLLVEMSALEEALASFSANYYSTLADTAFGDLATDYQPSAFANLSTQNRKLLKERAEELARLCATWQGKPNIRESTNMPRNRSATRNVADMGN